MTKKAEYKILTPVDLTSFGEIRIVNVETSPQEFDCRVEIILRNRSNDSNLTIAFEGVRELNIEALGSGTSIGPLKALDLRKDQWEWPMKVVDFEEEAISFYCKKIVERS
jgi:hypothetical protein